MSESGHGVKIENTIFWVCIESSRLVANKKEVVSVGTGTAILVILLQYVNKCKPVPLSFSRGGSVFESV